MVDEHKNLESRIDQFLSEIPNEAVSGFGTRISIASFLLMGLDPRSYPFYKPTAFEKVERVLSWPRTLEGESLVQFMLTTASLPSGLRRS